jgi:hypothetical protein
MTGKSSWYPVGSFGLLTPFGPHPLFLSSGSWAEAFDGLVGSGATALGLELGTAVPVGQRLTSTLGGLQRSQVGANL